MYKHIVVDCRERDPERLRRGCHFLEDFPIFKKTKRNILFTAIERLVQLLVFTIEDGEDEGEGSFVRDLFRIRDGSKRKGLVFNHMDDYFGVIWLVDEILQYIMDPVLFGREIAGVPHDIVPECPHFHDRLEQAAE